MRRRERNENTDGCSPKKLKPTAATQKRKKKKRDAAAARPKTAAKPGTETKRKAEKQQEDLLDFQLLHLKSKLLKNTPFYSNYLNKCLINLRSPRSI